MKIAIVVSKFNEDITERLLGGALERLAELGVDREAIEVTWVPGAVELPLVAQHFAKRDNIDAVICYGAVIRGTTDHYDYVCQQVSYGCQKVALTHNKPVIFGVLTTYDRAQALDRLGGENGHIGRNYAESAVEMIQLMAKLKEQPHYVEQSF